jgi:hypothetical protein
LLQRKKVPLIFAERDGRWYTPAHGYLFSGLKTLHERGWFMKHLRLVCALALLANWGAHYGYSQAVHATLLGTVTDVGGGVVPIAKVTITETRAATIRFPTFPRASIR